MLSIITKPLGCLFSLISTILTLMVIVIALLFAGFYYGVPAAFESVVSTATSFSANVADNDNSVLDLTVDLRDISIHNPSEYPTSDFLLVRTLKADFQPGDAQGDEILFREVVIDIERLTMAPHPDGSNNLLNFINELKSHYKKEQATEPQQPAQPWRIEKLILRIGNVNTVNSNGEIESNTIQYERSFTDVTSADTVLIAIAGELANKGIKPVLRALYQGLVGDIPEDLNTKTIKEKAIEAGEDIKQKASDVFNSLFE